MANNRASALRNGIATGLAFALLVGCGEDSGESTAQPVNGGQPPVVLLPAVTPAPVSQSFGPNQIAGEVFSASGPVVGAGISLWVQSPVYGLYWHRNGQLVTDSAGRFSAMGLPDDSTLIIKVLDDAYKQPCVTNVAANTRETIRVEVIPLAAFDAIEPPGPLAAKEPSLTGTVYADGFGGRTPAKGAEVRIENNTAIPIATALTSRDGRYYFCSLPTQVVIGVNKPGYVPATVRPVDSTRGVPVDIVLSQADDF